MKINLKAGQIWRREVKGRITWVKILEVHEEYNALGKKVFQGGFVTVYNKGTKVQSTITRKEMIKWIYGGFWRWNIAHLCDGPGSD